MDRFQDCCKAKATNALLQSQMFRYNYNLQQLEKILQLRYKNVYCNVSNKLAKNGPIFKIQVSKYKKISFNGVQFYKEILNFDYFKRL